MDQYDLDAFRAKALQQKGETKKIFKDLKRLKPKDLDREFHQAHDEAFQKIDCLKCANCCKTTGPLFTPSDITRLAKHFRLKPAQFSDQYLRLDEDGDMVLKSVPCPFLGPPFLKSVERLALKNRNKLAENFSLAIFGHQSKKNA